MDSKKENLLQKQRRIDRFSLLPDEILSKILSFLPVKDIVATSILSTRWKPLSPSSVALITLHFDDSYKKDSPNPFLAFRNFVDKLLNVTLRRVPLVEMVVLIVKDTDTDCDDIIASWVSAFVRLNVQHLRLISNQRDFSRPVFDALHGCSTLLELDMWDFLGLRLPEDFVLPNLKILSLYGLIFDVETDSFDKLLRSCPVLNDLRLTICSLVAGVILHIRHPNITKLVVDTFESWIGAVEIVIDAPNLESIMFEGDLYARYVMSNIKSRHSVSVDVDEHNIVRKSCNLPKLVEACSSATRLRLMGNLLKCFCHSPIPLPTFPNLTILALGRMGSQEWKILARFLESAPSLTTITFEEKLDMRGASVDLKSLLPVSLLLNIKKIEIWEFKGIPKELELMKYFLKEGRALQAFIVRCLPCRNKSGLEKLLTLPRYSEACQVLLKNKIEQEKSCEVLFKTGFLPV